jgi:BlaI family transcriptional regulator, penicillinase repressor
MSTFTPGELSVMQILWNHGEMKPSEIQELFPEPIKNPALRSYLSILLEKGHVSRRKEGKAFYYKNVTRRHSAFRKSLRKMVDTYCDGSTESLLMSLIRSEKLSEDELLELKRLADKKETPPKRKGK